MNKILEWLKKVITEVTGFHFYPKMPLLPASETFNSINPTINRELFLELNTAREEVINPVLPLETQNIININIGRVLAKAYKESLVSKCTTILISDNDLSRGGIKIDRLDDSFHAIKKYIVDSLQKQGFKAEEHSGTYVMMDSNNITAVLDSHVFIEGSDDIITPHTNGIYR